MGTNSLPGRKRRLKHLISRKEWSLIIVIESSDKYFSLNGRGLERSVINTDT
jgi:hypothetical protein